MSWLKARCRAVELVLSALFDPREVAVRAQALREAGQRLRDGDEGALLVVLPGQGRVELLDVAAVATLIGSDPRDVGVSGYPVWANVARLRTKMKRWALRPPPAVKQEPAAEAPEPAVFREMFAAALREHCGAKAAEFGPASLTATELDILVDDPSWAVGHAHGLWAGVLAQWKRRVLQ